MSAICGYISCMPYDMSLHGFCKGITSYIQHIYKVHGFDIARLYRTPAERLTASAVIYSRHYRQIWMIGDCQCIVNGVFYDNPKPYEDKIARKRSEYIAEALRNGCTVESFRKYDMGRAAILEELIDACQGQNKTYAVIDGFDILQCGIKVINLNNSSNEIILASDGYPFLKQTLKESETALQQLLSSDPLCIGAFKATKGLMRGNKSFDDRSYIRFYT